MANKPTKPNFPLGLESQDQSIFQGGFLNNGTIEHGPDAVLTAPETVDASGIPSAVRYNSEDDQFEGFYNEGGWLPLGGGNGGRWEALPHASSSLLQAGRAYLVDNTDGVSTVLFPSPKRIGDSVTVCDLYGKFSTYPLTVDGNGKSIYGSADSMTISTDNVSATFTWTGEARGWVITSGVGLGQGRVYSREIYSQILSVETSSIILSTQPTIVDVYVDGKRLKESLYTLDGYEVKFDPALASGSDTQIIQYIPIQLGTGGGGSGGTVITWEYNGGAAIGGETQIVLDVVVDSVSEIYIRGQRQQIGRGFTFDAATSTITLADELETGDDVVVVINGDPTVYNQIDRTPWEVARANNVSNAEVILSTDKQTALDGKTVLYDVVTQTSWGIPEGLPTGAKITSVNNGGLVYSPGGVSVELDSLPRAPIPEEILFPNGSLKDAITYLTPEMFKAVGDGATDDYQAIQRMFDAGAPGCVFEFDGSKTYYNAFGNKTKTDPWLPLEDRNEWRVPVSCTIKFNGAKLTRRRPFWNENNAVNNMNSGAYYTDDHTALLRISSVDNVTIYDPNFDGNVPVGTLVNTSGVPTTQTNYAVGECMDFGLIIENSNNIKIRGGFFTNCVFPVYVDGVDGLDFQGEVQYAAQASKRVTPTDLAYGGGLKLLNSSNVRLDLVGKRNVNTTAEIESLNSNVMVKGWSNLDYSNSIVVFGSQHVHIDWTARNVVNGVGAYIRGGFTAMETNFITGNIVIDSASFYGCYIYQAASASTDMFGINLNVQTRNCGSHGLYINAEAGGSHIIDGVNITHQSYGDDGGSSGTGAPTRVNGLVKGEVKINPSNAYQGFWASGNNLSNTACVVKFSGNIRGATNKWTITSTMRVDIDLVSNTNHYRLTCSQFIDTGAITAGGGFENTNSYIRSYGRFSQDQTTYPLFPKMKGTVSGSNYELVYDPTDFVLVEGAKKYNVQLVILN